MLVVLPAPNVPAQSPPMLLLVMIVFFAVMFDPTVR
jgi:hypothetical protein